MYFSQEKKAVGGASLSASAASPVEKVDGELQSTRRKVFCRDTQHTVPFKDVVLTIMGSTNTSSSK